MAVAQKNTSKQFLGGFWNCLFSPPFSSSVFRFFSVQKLFWIQKKRKKKASVKSFVRWKGGEGWELLASYSSSSRSVQNVLSLFWQHICYNLFLFLSPRQLCLEKAHCAQYSLKIVLQYFSSQWTDPFLVPFSFQLFLASVSLSSVRKEEQKGDFPRLSGKKKSFHIYIHTIFLPHFRPRFPPGMQFKFQIASYEKKFFYFIGKQLAAIHWRHSPKFN